MPSSPGRPDGVDVGVRNDSVIGVRAVEVHEHQPLTGVCIHDEDPTGRPDPVSAVSSAAEVGTALWTAQEASMGTSRSTTKQADTAIVDVDGTLVDTNYQHTLAWYRAFRRYHLTIPVWHIHRSIGMGGDQLIPHVAGDRVAKEHGEALEQAWTEEFRAMVDEVRPFEGAHELLVEIKDRGFQLVLASSGKKEFVEHFLDLIDGKSIADAWTTSEDADKSKPEPDLLQSAMAKVPGAHGLMIGDSTWDCIAANKLSVPTLAIRTGGFSVEELTGAGALRVFDSLVDLRASLDDTPLAQPG